MSRSLNNYYDGQPHISHISFKFKVLLLRTRLMVDSSFINLDTTVKQKPQFILLLPSSSSTPNQLPNPTDSTSLKFTHLSFIITKLFQIPHFLTANLCFGWSSNSRLSHTSQLERPLNFWIPAFFSSFFFEQKLSTLPF